MQVQNQKFGQIGSFTIGKTLGSGANAKVKLGIRDGSKYAVKILKKTTVRELKSLQHEIQMLKDLNHPNIVNLIEAGQADYVNKSGKSENKYYLVMELAEGGELFEYVANTGPFNVESCRYYCKQILDALCHAHNLGICHRDLKPENILMDLSRNLKIADFGFATLIQGKQGDNKLYTQLGTESYMAPEIHNKQAYNGESVDLFAASIIFFIMFVGTPPFTKAVKSDPYYRLIINKENDKFWNAHARFKPVGFFTSEFKDFMNKTLANEPSERMSLQEILQHPWMNQQTSTYEEIQAEFSQRQKVVLQSLEKERLQKQAQKDQQKQQNKVQVGGFRGISRNKEQEQEFANIEEQYPQLKIQRELQQIEQDDTRQNDLITSENPEYLIRSFLVYFEQAQVQVKLAEGKYKINVIQNPDEQDKIVNLDVQIFKLDNELNCVQFNRKQGDLFQFYNFTKEIKDYIQTSQQDQE